MLGVAIKDRRWVKDLADGVVIVYERSSTHPMEYAITLRVRTEGRWHTMCLFDNAHAVEEHHEHRYVGDVKQPPRIAKGPANVAMDRAMHTLITSWEEIVRAWEQTR